MSHPIWLLFVTRIKFPSLGRRLQLTFRTVSTSGRPNLKNWGSRRYKKQQLPKDEAPAMCTRRIHSTPTRTSHQPQDRQTDILAVRTVGAEYFVTCLITGFIKQGWLRAGSLGFDSLHMGKDLSLRQTVVMVVGPLS
jgi:hypothetical protein